MEPHVFDPLTGQPVRLHSARGQEIYNASQISQQSSTVSRAASLQWGASPTEWTSSCGDCCDNCGICCKGLWCPCALHGDIKEHVSGVRPEDGGYCILCCIQSLCCLPCFNCVTCCEGKPLRSKLRRMYGLSKGGNCCGSDCCTHYCCHSCAQCQEAREIWFRGEALETTLASKPSQAFTPPPVVMMESLRISETKSEPIRVGYEVALKNGHADKSIYSGLEYQVFVEGSTDWYLGNDIQDWIKSKIADTSWDGVLAYNDQGDHSCLGHAKGIVVWNQNYVGWLIHSVPHWPFFLKKKGQKSIPEATKVAHIEGSMNVLSGIPESARKEGQSFMWVVFDRKKTYFTGSINSSRGILNDYTPVIDILHEVNKRVNAIGKCTFAECLEENALKDLDTFHHDAGLNHSVEFSLLSLSPNSKVSESPLVHAFKTKNWKPDAILHDKLFHNEESLSVPDFYRHGLLVGYGPMVTKTWVPKTHAKDKTTSGHHERSKTVPHNATRFCNGHDHNFHCDKDVKKADTIQHSIKGKMEMHAIHGEGDHSKIAYSSDENEKVWAFVGDLNRSTAQGIRSGGGILIKDHALRTLFKNMTYPDIHPQHGLEYEF